MLKILILLIFLIFPKSVGAEDLFTTKATVNYEISEDGKTNVSNSITVKNKSSDVYAKEFKFILNNHVPKNIEVLSSGETLPFNTESKNKQTIITVLFPKAVAGRGKTNDFEIRYILDGIAVRTGDVWEISIPKLSDDETFDDYKLRLVVPKTIGDEAYVSPQPENYYEDDEKLTYEFDEHAIRTSGITASFGKFQVYSFELNYHLENPLKKNSVIEIALPPDTSLQKVYYEEITPEPINVEIDEDGNWIAKYELKARERIDVKALGAVQIFANSRRLVTTAPATLIQNLKPTKHWQSDDPSIISLSNTYDTPEKIYNFVKNSLTYDYSRAKPNVDRRGALEAINNSQSAICMEYTDLFIAISRAAGIPAREINGFAYTENSNLHPLSLVADVLHSWPEYWDSELGVWIGVDPTWGHTTGGIDYFEKLDLKHFTFAIHGLHDNKPYAAGSYKLGPNPQKDVYVRFGQLPTERGGEIEINASIRNLFNPFKKMLYADFTNVGKSSLTGIFPSIYYDNEKVREDYIVTLPPFSKHNLRNEISYGLFAKNAPNNISIYASEKEVIIKSKKFEVISMQLIIFFTILLATIIMVLVKIGKLRINMSSYLSNIKHFAYENIIKKITKISPKKR